MLCQLLLFIIINGVISSSPPDYWDLDPCEPNPCRNSGLCSVDEDGGFKCDCTSTGYLGSICDVENPCVPDHCSHGGTCSTNELFTAVCNCSDTGYIGDRCELKNPCLPNPCLNKGVCTYDVTNLTFTCHCEQTGYTGNKCERVDPCFDKCFNGASCFTDGNKYYCSCEQGYAGNWCQFESLGCYQDIPDGRHVAINPGIADFDQCLNYCRKNNWYAGYRDLNICLCAENPTNSFVDDGFCNDICPVSVTECNSHFYYALFDKSDVIKDLVIEFITANETLSGDGLILSVNTLYTIGVNFTDVHYFLNYDVATSDGYSWIKSDLLTINHAFSSPGDYLVEVSVNDIDGNSYYLVQKVKVAYGIDVQSPLTCDMNMLDITCILKVNTGSDISAEANFRDGVKSTFTIDCPVIVYGSSAENPNLNLTWDYPQARYIKYNEFIKESGRLIGWEVDMLSPGEVIIEVYRSFSNISQLVADTGGTLKKECQQKTHYVFSKQKCRTESTYLNPVYISSKPAVNLSVVHVDSYYTNLSGKQYIPLRMPFHVKKGDIIGWHYVNSGVIALAATPSGPEFIRPTPKDESRILAEITSDTIISTSDNAHILRAVVVRPSTVVFQHRCKEIYLDEISHYCPVEVTMVNNISRVQIIEYLRVAPPISNVTINGIEFARTSDIATLSVFDHPGMELRFCDVRCTNTTYNETAIVYECISHLFCVETSVEDHVYYKWNFGNGNSTVTRNKSVDVIYYFPGTYNISLHVYNNNTEDFTSLLFEVQENLGNIHFEQATPQPQFTSFSIAVTNISQAAHAKWTQNGTKPILMFTIGTEHNFTFTVNPGETVSFQEIAADNTIYRNVIASNKGLCRNQLGLQSFRVGDSQIQASSTLMHGNATFYPHWARLNNPYGAWLPNSNGSEDRIQVDLGELFVVTGIITQGSEYGVIGWTEYFSIEYSLDGYSWILETDYNKKYYGNQDETSHVTNIFDGPLVARFIGIIIPVQSRQVGLRFELLGCKSGEICVHQLGMENGLISDEQIQNEKDPTFKVSYARLGNTDEGSPGGWCPEATDGSDDWMQVDLLQLTTITGFIIQGSFKNATLSLPDVYLNYSSDNVLWKGTQTFSGKMSTIPHKRLMLDKDILTRYIRLHPITSGGLCLRFDLIGCKDSRLCGEPLGLESGDVPDDSFSASTSSYTSFEARLNNDRYWRASVYRDAWIMVQFKRMMSFTGVITEGVVSQNSAITKYKLAFSLDSQRWTFYKENGKIKIFEGNVPGVHSRKKNMFDYVIMAKSARLNSFQYHRAVVLRMEWLGCYAPPVCQDEVSIIGKKQLKNSWSEYPNTHTVDMGEIYTVSGIRVDGTETGWSFVMRHSFNKRYWYDVIGNIGKIREFFNPSEIHMFATTFDARFIQFHLTSDPLLQYDLQLVIYGCKASGDLYLTSSRATDIQINIHSYNFISNNTVSTNAYFIEEILNFALVESPQYFVHGEDVIVEGTVSYGSNFTFVTDIKNVSIVSYSNNDYKTNNNVIKIIVPIDWGLILESKNFSAVVTIDNFISYPVSSTGVFILHYRVTDLKVWTNKDYYATNESAIIYYDMAVGSKITCSVEFGDGNITEDKFPFMSRDHPYEVNFKKRHYMYSEPGKYVITVACYNQVSKEDKTVYVIYQNKVTNIRITSHDEIVRIRSPDYGILEVNYFFSGNVLRSPTDANASYTITNKLTDEIKFQTEIDFVVVSTLNVVHQVDGIDVGSYRVDVNIHNMISSETFTFYFEADEVIGNLTISLVEHARVHEEVVFNVSVLFGSRITYVIDFMDGNTDIAEQGNSYSLFKHSYTNDGVYSVSVNASNFVDAVVTTANVTIQFPVDGFEVTIPWYNKLEADNMLAKVPVTLTHSVRFHFPSNSHYEIKVEEVELLSGKLYKTEVTSLLLNINESGYHELQFHIWNLVSYEIYEARFVIMEEITGLSVVLTMNKLDATNMSLDLEIPRDNNRLYLPRDHKLVMTSSVSTGNKITYTTTYTNGELDTTDDPRSYIKFKKPGEYVIIVNASNAINYLMWESLVIVQETVVRSKLRGFGPSLKNTTTQFNLKLGKVGTDACYRVDFKDNTSEGDGYIQYFGLCEYCMSMYDIVSDWCTELDFQSLWNKKHIDGISVSLQIENKFMTVGMYEVELLAFNHASNIKRILNQVITRLPCYFPNVTVAGLNGCTDNFLCNSQTQNRQYYGSVDVFVLAEVVLNCQETKFAEFIWQAYRKNGDIEEEYELPSTVKTTGMGLSELVIPAKTLQYGTYVFSLTVTMLGEVEGISTSDTTVIEIIPTPLHIGIDYGSFRSVGWDTIITLDSSLLTYDPDIKESDKSGMNFTWLCRRKTYKGTTNRSIEDVATFQRWNERFTVLLREATLNKEFKPYKEVDDVDGCFGRFGEADGHVSGGVLNVTGPVAVINTYGMYWNMEYEMWLTVWKEHRTATFRQVLDVHEGRPPDVQMSCKLNCKVKKNPTNRLSIEANNKDSKRGVTLYYRWKIFMYSDINGYQEIDQNRVMIFATTGVDVANLSIEPGLFRKNTRYRIQLDASRNVNFNNKGTSKLDFMTNDAPIKGKCNVNPDFGIELATDFIISCFDYKDNEIPLVYQYSVRPSEDLNWAIIYSGYDSTSSAAKFPAGFKANNYSVAIRVRVTDSIGSFVEDQSLTVQVVPGQCSYGNIFYQYEIVIGVLATRATSGDFGSVCNSAISISGLLNRCTQMAEEARDFNYTIIALQEKTRQELLRAMSYLTPAYTLSSMNQMASALDQLTVYMEQITPDAMILLEYLVGTFTQTFKFIEGVSAEELEEAAKLSFYSLGRLRSNTSSVSHDTGSQVIQFMTDSVTDLMVTGQNDVMISSEMVSVTVSKAFTAAIVNGTKPFLDRNNNPITKIPDVIDLFGEGNDTSTEIQVQVISRTSNPYSVEDPSVTLGSMISLDLKNDTDQTVIPANPEAAVEFMISMGVEGFNSNSQLENVYTYHEAKNGVLSCRTLADVKKHSAVVIEVIAHTTTDMSLYTTYKYNIEVYLKVNGVASEDNYDLSCSLSQNLTTYNDTDDGFHEQEVYWNNTYPSTLGGYTSCVFSNTMLSKLVYSSSDVSICAKNDVEEGETEPSIFRFKLGAFTSSCYYRSEDVWKQEGCVVGNETTIEQTQCFCLLIESGSSYDDSTYTRKRRTAENAFSRNGVATFSGGLAVSFNTISLSIGLNQLAENPVVFAFMLSCICFYFVVILWARKKDKRDLIKAGVSPMIDNSPRDYYNYEVTFFTGVRMGSGTSSNVSFILSGEQGQTGIRVVKDKKREILKRGSIDSFLMSVPCTLGTLVHLRIWHDNSGNAKWFLSRVLIKDLQTNRSYYFMVDRWFSLDEDDAQIERVIPTAGLSEITSFGYLFHSKTRRNLSDAHIWLSVFLRPAKSTFTRCQRATCCLSLLFCTMMANILLYKQDEDGDATSENAKIKIGGFEISLMEITIGIISSLIVFPVNIVIVQLFRLSRPAPTNQSCFDCLRRIKPSNKYRKNMSKYPIESETEQYRPNERDGEGNKKQTREVITLNINPTSLERDNKAKKRKPLPWWCLYVGWILSFITIGIAMWLTIGVAANFGAEKAEHWLTSICVSLFQDILISQPIKVIFLATFYSLVIKSPDKEDVDGPSPELKSDEEWLHEKSHDEKEHDGLTIKRDASLANTAPPDSDEIEDLKRERQKAIQMNKILKEVATYLLFLVILIIVAFGNIGTDIHGLQKSMIDAYINAGYHGKKPFYKIYSREYFWDYMDEVFVPSLYSRKGINGTTNEHYEVERVTSDRTSSLLSTARLRQVRVQHDYCNAPDDLEMFNIMCRPSYSYGSEEDNDFTENWILLNDSDSSINLAFEDIWKYKSWYNLGTLPQWGRYSYYGGGGYVANLGETDEIAWQTTKHLRQSKWVDQYTRAVFIEFSVYNPPTNLFGVSNMIVEFPPTGGAVTFYYFPGVLLDRYIGGLGMFVIICEVAFSLFVLLFLYREISAFKKERKAYFKKFGNLMELSVLLLSLVALVAYINRYITGNQLKLARKENINQFLNFQLFAVWEQVYYYVLGFILFISTIKFLKLLRFNRRMLLLSNTISYCWLELILFLVVFFIVFVAYASCGYIIFNSALKNYSSFLTTIECLFSTLLGKFDFLSMQEESRVLGALYFFSFMMSIVFVLMNMFLTIINEAFSQTRADNEKLNNELEIVDFMIHRFKLWTGFKEKRVRVRKKQYTYIEGIEPIQTDCDKMQQMLMEMVDKLNEFIRQEKSDDLGLGMESKRRTIFTC